MSQIELFESRLSGKASGAAATVNGAPATPDSVLDALEATLTESQDFHRLFDAKLIRVRQRMSLPVTQPTSLNNVPSEHEVVFREEYVRAARDVGNMFLKIGRLADAWAYFRTIGEPEPVRTAIEQIAIPEEPDAAFEETMNLALYEGAHVVRGLECLLKTHGTCNTITAMGQLLGQMTPDERRQAAAMMVQNIYSDLRHSVSRDVASRQSKPESTHSGPEAAPPASEPTPPASEPTQSLGELLSMNEGLLADGNYHIDVSHLHSTVGFARNLKHGDPELALAIELCQYGSQLSSQLQYPADVPFDEYYVANRHFLKAIANIDVEASLQYFFDRLKNEPDEPDQKLIAFVIVDLGQRIDRIPEVLETAGSFVSRLEDPNGFSFSAVCLKAGRADLLQQAARRNDDVLAYATALLSDQQS